MFLVFAQMLFSQQDVLEGVTEEDRERDPNSESRLHELLAEPIDLNFATAEELLAIPFLSSVQIGQFLDVRRQEVQFARLDRALEALQVSGDTLEFARNIFCVSTPISKKKWHASARWRIGKPAQSDENWQGAAYRSSSRLRVEFGHWRGATILERDAGEKDLNDLHQWYLEWRPEPQQPWHIIVGNYYLEWAHGLVLWGPYESELAGESRSRKTARGVRPYAGTQENWGFRGACATYTWRAVQLMTFASRRNLDTRLNADGHPVALCATGYHRTETELLQCKNLTENSFGAGIRLRLANHMQLGVLAQNSGYSKPWALEHRETDYFKLTGRSNHVLSAFAEWHPSTLNLGMEIARSKSGGHATSLLITELRKSFDWALSIFHLGREFHSVHGIAGSQAPSFGGGEWGYATAMRLKPWQRMNLAMHYEHSNSLWRTNTMPFPPHRESASLRCEWKFTSICAMHASLHLTQGEELHALTGAQRLQLERFRRSFRLEVEHKLTSSLTLRPRLDFAVEYDEKEPGESTSGQASLEPDEGTAFTLGLDWRIGSRMLVSVRQALFEAAAPIYQYERDLPGSFTVRALRERGSSRYIYFHWITFHELALAFKLATVEEESSNLEHEQLASWGIQIEWSP